MLLQSSAEGISASSMRWGIRLALPALVLLLAAAAAPAAEAIRSLFDGRSLDGWEVPAADAKWWRVERGLIVGGSLAEKIPHNVFLASRASYENFELTLRLRLRGSEGFINSGVQIRSLRVPGSSEMQGYQVDAGEGWWGKLYDESRRNRVIAEAADPAAVAAAGGKGEWNEYRILAQGRRIRSWINGVAALDYLEPEPGIAQGGQIGFQVHGGGKTLVELADIKLRELPPTPGAMTWALAARLADQPLLSPEEEMQCFQVPDDFQVELVAAESPGIGKFVAVAFDARGRLWTMTALEYPVDANEAPEASRQLFAQGGRDKVLVIDRPFENPPSAPRVFAAGLAIPLGILPWGHGALVQYGSEIRYYRDGNGDGQADRHETILEGFGTQDSHLFPHQFTRVPGGQILLAQGVFNDSTVKRPGNQAFAGGSTAIRFPHCKLASFSPDGSRFEPLTAGPNNIWGLTISREGETWIQEANDLGYPIIPYSMGGRYPSVSTDRLRPYQPLTPPTLAPPQMGGTGLSGLAIADDANGWPDPWGARGARAGGTKRFYLANPITNSVQKISATPEGVRYRYAKQPDFLLSADRRFRPVAMQFGPDGCLYIVDWYNKIISHNEVPRSHPERDKTTGRIWRIRHRATPRQLPPVLAELPETQLLQYLGADNVRTAELAWQQIVDRRATALIPELRQIAQDRGQPAARRLGALWALEGLGAATPELLQPAAADSSPNVRHEAVCIAGRTCSESDFVRLAQTLVDDPSPRVRAALGDALRRLPATESQTVLIMMRLGRAPLAGGDEWDVYDRQLERFLARWAMENHAPLVAQTLKSAAGAALPIENRALATLALGSSAAAAGLVDLIPQLGRPLSEEEIRVLCSSLDDGQVARALSRLAGQPSTRIAVLQSLLRLRTSLNAPQLRGIVLGAVQRLWAEDPSPGGRRLALEAIGAFGFHELESAALQFICAAETPRGLRLSGLRTLRELGVRDDAQLLALARQMKSDPEVRSAAIAALAAAPRASAGRSLLAAWDDFTLQEHALIIDRLSAHRGGAEAILQAIDDDTLTADDIPVADLQQMRELLPDNRAVEQLWGEVAGRVHRVLRLTGTPGDSGDKVTLVGPFTVETWAQLLPEIDNRDSLLSAHGQMNINFFDQRLRVYVGDRDLVIARFRTLPEVWAHYAITRDAQGFFSLYVNGELDSRSTQPDPRELHGLRIGLGLVPRSGTDARFTEFRVWNAALGSQQIRDNFDRSFVGAAQPPGLVKLFTEADWGQLQRHARLEPTLDVPPLVSETQAAARAKKFDHFRQLAEQSGDAAAGRALFAKRCLVCHQQAGQGGKIGPALDGVGLHTTEALLRNLLTPSAAMEGGYRSFRVLTKDGRVLQGLLVSRDTDAIVLRQVDTADLKLSTSDLMRAEFTNQSVMPDGLLESLTPREVADLFAYIRTLNRK